MVRSARYWERLAYEIPEGPIRALEAAGRRRQGPILDDLAIFASKLTPRQSIKISEKDLAIDAPNDSLENNIEFLKAWNSLPTLFRTAALEKRGLAIDQAGSSGRALMNCLRSQLEESFNNLPLFAYLLTGGPAPVEGLVLRVTRGQREGRETYTAEIRTGSTSLAMFEVPVGWPPAEDLG